MTPLRTLVPILLLAACGGSSGPSDDPGGSGPVVLLQKAAASGDGQTGVVADTLGAPVAVLVTEDGVPAPGRVVTFTPAAGAGVAVAAVDTTDANGLAQTTWILGTVAGVRSLSASTPGASGPPLTFVATALAGPVADLAVNAGDGQAQEVGQSFAVPVVVLSVDAFGNPVSGVVVGWGTVSGSGNPDAGTSVSGADGKAAVTVTAGNTPGVLAIRATVASLPGDTATIQLHVTPVASVVTVASNFFSPADDTIPVGGAVRWVWSSGRHNVGQLSGPSEFTGSLVQDAPAAFGPVLFTVPGTYLYECTVHAGMLGTITVQ